ncbi:GntR family transcriptional regulator [Microlunatus aurantiacus]|uniref:GntR family transcriptional regulator n=1 Tax=Microlunatus aurantiacus TaxID=446786 RepID=A0ABP7DJ54_9ACTN
MTELDEALYAPSLLEVTTRRLRDEILSGDLAPGQRLVEEQIRQRFAISRAPLREALRTLANQGLVEHLPRRGTRVTELSTQDVDQLFALRSLLERHAIETTFPLAGTHDGDPLASVRGHLDQMRRADQIGDDLAKDDAHRAFHAAVVALAGNRQLDLALEPILLRLQRPMAANLRREAAVLGTAAGIERHERLLLALESNDRRRILAELDDHGGRQFLAPESAPPGLAALPG